MKSVLPSLLVLLSKTWFLQSYSDTTKDVVNFVVVRGLRGVTGTFIGQCLTDVRVDHWSTSHSQTPA